MTRTTFEFLSHLRNLDVRIWVDHEQLRVNAPDGVLTAELRTELSARKPEIIEFLRQAGHVTHMYTSSIQPFPRNGRLPLSFAQQRVWILDQLQILAFSNMPTAVRITGNLNPQLLERSLNEIIRRHEMLRTTFMAENGTPFQVIAPTLVVQLPVVDLQGFPETEQEIQARLWIVAAAQHNFKLEQLPLFHISLLRLQAEDHVLFLNFHHIISDAWSQSVLAYELISLYDAFANNRPTLLPELPIQYADFARWQQEFLQSDHLKQTVAYWAQQLTGPLPMLDLPAYHVGSNIKSQAVKQVWAIDHSLAEDLKALSQRETVTVFITLLAAVKTLLHRYTGQTDILVGVPIFDRSRSEVQKLIGLFLNTLVLRTDLSGNPTFLELLRRVRQTVQDAFTHKDLPFERLVEEIQPERNLTRNPLFQVTFVMQNVPATTLELPGLKLAPFQVDFDSGTPPDLLGFNIEERGGDLLCELEHKADLLNQGVLLQFQTLLKGIVANPQQRLSDLPLLAESEQQKILREWHITKPSSTPPLCLHLLFERQVEKSPDAIAVVLDDSQVTYQELNRRANQLAHYLRSLGVGPEVLVGICMERSLEMIVGILGILKAGGAYLPLDLAYPKDRLSFVLTDSQATVLLTQQQLLEKLPDLTITLVCCDSDWDTITRGSDQNPAHEITADHLAYTIYTSGSTGKPKGVLVEHRQVSRLFTSTQPWFQFDEKDIWTFFHSHSFDFSVWEMWGAFLYGGKLVVVPYWVSRSPDVFYTLLNEEQVTVLNQTPSAFRQLIWAEKTFGTGRDLALRFVIFGGEALELNSLKPWFEHHGDVRPQLVNMYGITETTVHVTYRPVVVKDLEESPGSMIGNPIPDLQVYILDQRLQPVPAGIVGEMYVGGDGLARAYLNRPKLTAERFIPNPYSDTSGSRLYRSGDLAYYLPNRDIVYLGRIDHQVKIRGFRIELGEIEAVINQHTAIRETAVLAWEHESGEKQLVAYLVPHASKSLSVNEIRSFLKDHLPDYMIPSAFVTLDVLPLTLNGKLDKRALPTPNITSSTYKEEFVAPETPVEKRVAEIWAKLLGVEQVSIYDTFFDLGGYSLLATQVIHEINKVFGLNLSLRHLFEEHTIAGLALLIEETLLEKLEGELLHEIE